MSEQYNWDKLLGNWEMEAYKELSDKYQLSKGKQIINIYASNTGLYAPHIMVAHPSPERFGFLDDMDKESKVSLVEYIEARHAKAVEDYKLGVKAKAEEAREKLIELEVLSRNQKAYKALKKFGVLDNKGNK